jgi:hypothetical protein
MLSHTNVQMYRFLRGLVALTGVTLAGPACFLPTPPLEEETTAATASSSSETTEAAPTTTADTSSSGASTTTGEPESTEGSTTAIEGTSTSTETTEEPASTGTTEFSLPECPYEPPGAVMSLLVRDGSVEDDRTHQACGTKEVFTGLQLALLASTLTFTRCDAGCRTCDAEQTVDLALIVPDPFATFGVGVEEGGCYDLGVAWERPLEGGEACEGSTVSLRRMVGAVPAPVPSFLYRHASELEAMDAIGGFALTAVPSGPGPVACPCDGDCCSETPGTRVLQFTIEVEGEEFMGAPLEAEQAQEVELGFQNGEPNKAGISLVRANFPSACEALPSYQWLFRFPTEI